MIFRFYDTGLRLAGPDAGIVYDQLSANYSRFRMGQGHAAPSRILQATLQTVKGGLTCLLQREERTVCFLPPMEPSHLAEVLIRRVLSQVRSHLLFHGAALGWNGQGLVLAGPSGSGKTTLSLFMQSRGYTLLSDETSAVAQESGLLHPFPRRPAPDGASEGVRSALRTEPTTAVPLRCLFLLRGAKPLHYRTIVQCGAVPDALVARVREALPGIMYRPETANGLPGFVQDDRMKPAHFARLVALCERHDVAILDVLEVTNPTDFGRPPHLQPCTVSRAALSLLQHLQNGLRSSLLRERLGGNPALLYALIARVLTGVDCYQLRVGSVTDTSTLIGQVVGS